MFRRFHRPVTYAAALWILVGMAAGMFVATLAYVSLLSDIRNGVTKVFPPKSGSLQAEQLPSLFGTVRSVDADGLTVDSKQLFTRVLIEDGTSLTTVGGAATSLSEIKAGAVVTATGKDMGGGILAAAAVVVLEQGSGEVKPISLLDAPTDWKEWAKMPALIGWGAPDGEYAFALRGYDLEAPAVSVELYDWGGKLTARIELDVPGYKRLKPLNQFLTPEAAEKRLSESGIAFPPGAAGLAYSGTSETTVGFRWVSPDATRQVQVNTSKSGKRTVLLSEAPHD